MIKVLDKELERKFKAIIKGNEQGAASEIVQTLKGLQDASGVKVCKAVTVTDSMYKEVR